MVIYRNIRVLTLTLMFLVIPNSVFAEFKAEKLIPSIFLLLEDTPAVNQCRVTLLREESDTFSAVSAIPQFTQVDDQFFFTARTANNNNDVELWVSNGLPSGTRLVKDIGPGTISGLRNVGSGSYLTAANGKLFFFADDNNNGYELWVSDGTEQGTNMVKDINLGQDGLVVQDAIAFEDKFYFLTNGSDSDSIQDEGLWVSDGTSQGTILIKDVNPSSRNSFISGGISNVRERMTVVNGQLLFSASDNFSNREPWISDGTTQGTTQIADINQGNPTLSGSSNPTRFRTVGDTAYFLADSNVVGEELYRYRDGDVALVEDINVGSFGSVPRAQVSPDTARVFVALEDERVLFVARDSVNGDELWVSNGSSSGTMRVSQVAEGGDSRTSIESATSIGNRAYFNADDNGASFGNELWVTDGTVNGTRILKDISPGLDSSNPEELIANEQFVFFEAGGGSSRNRTLFALDQNDNFHRFSIGGSNLALFNQDVIFVNNAGLYILQCPTAN